MIKKRIDFLFKSKRIYFVFLALVIVDRLFLLTNFSFKFVGSDDMIFWEASHDYLQGKFYAPYFYGQDYNFMLESLFAVPLLALNVPYYQALPISTSFIALFPFVFFSYTLFKRGYVTESIFIISIPLLLPIEYGMLSSMTRGFIQGLFFCGFLVLPLLEPLKKSSWIIFSTMTAAAYVFNPNAVLFLFPVCLYMWMSNFKQIRFYLITVLCALPILSIEYFSQQFFVSNKETIIHRKPVLEYSFNVCLDSLKELDIYFSNFSPLTWFAGWLSLVIAFIIGIALLRRDVKKGVSLILGVLFILSTLGFNKTHDRLDTIFLSSQRMFLAIPLFIGLAAYWGRDLLAVSNNYFKVGLLATVICTLCIKLSLLNAVIDQHTKEKNYGSISIKKVKDLTCECARIKDTLTIYPVDLIIYSASWQKHLNSAVMEFCNYGCPLLEKGFPTSMMSIYDRRSWVFNQKKSAVVKNILIYNSDADFNILQSMKNCKLLTTQDPKMFIISNNTLPTDSLFRLLKLDLWMKAP